MSAIRSFLYMTPCIVMMLTGASVFSDDTFYVFAPDQKNQQMLSLSVQTGPTGVSISKGKPLRLPFGPSSVATHPNGKHLIVNSPAKETPPVATLEILAGGEMRLVATSSLGQPAGYTSVDRNGRYLMSVHYGSGQVAVHRIQADGVVGDQICSLKTPRTEAHCILTTPDNSFVYIPCVKNNNALYQYAVDEQSGRLSPLDPFDSLPPAMFGPRHVAYHPTLPIAYFSNEQQLGVSVYEIGNDGQLADKQHAVSMPRRSPYEQGKRDLHASDLAVSEDGTRLFLAVRDFAGDEDSVFAFRIETDGKLSQLNHTKVADIPWKLDLSPDGKYLVVSEVADGVLSVFEIEPNGALTLAARIDWGMGVRDMAVVALPN